MLDSVFVIDIWNNQGLNKCCQPRPLALPIILTLTLITPDTTKTASNKQIV